MIDVNLIGAPAFAVRVVGGEFVFAGVNARLSRITGLEPADLVGRTPHACLPGEVADGVTARYQACVAARQPSESEMLLDGPAGARWWHVTLTPVLDRDGAVASLIGVSTDVSDRRIAEQKERDAEIRMALAMDVLDGGFWHLDAASGEIEASPKLALLMTGSSLERMTWGDFVARIHPDDRDRFDRVRHPAESLDAETVDYRVRDAHRNERWLRSKSRAIQGDAGTSAHVVGVVTDLTEHKRLEALYARAAMTDPLTGLLNRRGFDASASRFAEAAARTGTPFGLILVDLDDFKPVNDRHGHAVGDAVLRGVAARFAEEMRPDDVVARIGGDEFAILVADAAAGDLPRVAERLLASVRVPIRTPAGALSVGISVGLATSRAGERDVEDLAARADGALYAVKSTGRGAWRAAA